VLVGRDAERAAIAALLEAARGSSGGALLVRGVAGSGKSALLADAAGAADGMTVLRTQGVESESPLAFAALQRLLWALRKDVGGLPAPQRAAVQAAFGEVEGEGDRFLTFLGTLSLLADAADERPVLVIADDAHWLDEASANALLSSPAGSSGQPALTRFPHGWLALLAALRDQRAQLAGHLQAIEALPSAGVTGPLVDDLARWARALTAETPTATLHHLEQMATPMARLAALDRVEAAVRAGRAGLARDWSAELDQFGVAVESGWARAAAAYGRAAAVGSAGPGSGSGPRWQARTGAPSGSPTAAAWTPAS